MDTVQTLRVLRERWTVFVSVVLLCLLAGAAVTASMQRTYSATAGLFVSVVLPKDPAALAGSNTFATARVQSYVTLATTPSVTDYVVRELNLPLSSNALAMQITADAPLNRVLLNVRVRDTSAGRAALIANAVAQRLTAVVGDLEQGDGRTGSPVRLTLVRPAAEPTSPLQPRVKLNIALSLLAGLLLGLGAARLRHSLDDAIRHPRDLERTSRLAVLAVLPGGRRGPAAVLTGPRAGVADRAAALAASNLENALVQSSPSQLLAITSLRPGEGKTHLTLLLGRVLSSADRKVCLVDADLRSPGTTDRLGVPSAPGLMGALRDVDQTLANVQEVGDDLHVLGSGPRPPNPLDVLARPQTLQVLETVSRCFRYTLVDTGAMEPYGDGLQASALAPAVVLVVSASGRSRRRKIAAAVSALEAGGTVVLGTVLNNASGRDAESFLRTFSSEAPTGIRALIRT